MADSDLSVNFTGRTDDLNNAIDRAQTMVARFSASLKSAFTGVDTAKAQTSMRQVGDAADDASGKTKDAGAQSETVAARIGDSFGAIGAVVASVAQHYVDLTQRVEALVDPIRQASGSFDQSTQSMGAINAVAGRSGLSLTQLGNSFHELQTKAAAGDRDIVAALNAIGLKVSEVASLTQDQLAVKMADAFSKAQDSANKAQAGVILFGSDVAGKLVPQLDQGAARMTELIGAANRTGQALGPDFIAKVQGTEGLLQVAQDRITELKNAWQGFVDSFKVAEFQEVKGSLDGLIQLFNDVSRNVLDVAEKFTNLVGAGQRTSDSLGLVGTVVQFVSMKIVEATAYIEEMAVKGTQQLAQMGITFEGLSKVVQAFGNDVQSVATKSAGALYAAFQEAIGGVIALFGDLATAAKSALSFDMSGVSSAFAKFGGDVSATQGKIATALAPVTFQQTRAAVDAMTASGATYAKSLDAVIGKLEAQKNAELALIAAGGRKGSAVPQTRKVGDPKAPDEDKSSGNDKLETAMREADGEVQAVKAAEKQKQELLDAGVKLHMLSEGQKLAATRAAVDAEFAAEKAIYQKELELDGLKPQQRQEILNKMAAAQAAHDSAMLKLQIQAAEETVKTWDQATSSISSAMTSQIDGLLKRTTTFGQAMKNVFASLIQDVLKFCTEWAVKQAETIALNIAGVNAQTAAQVAGAAAGTSAQTAGAAASSLAVLAGVVKSITASAGEAFAGVFGFLSPVLGPAAAGPAAAAQATVMGSLPSFAVGAWSLPSDMVAQLHAGEMVVPAGPAAMMRAAAGGAGVGGVSMGDMHFHIDGSKSPQEIMGHIADNVRGLARMLNEAWKLNPTTRPKF